MHYEYTHQSHDKGKRHYSTLINFKNSKTLFKNYYRFCKLFYIGFFFFCASIGYMFLTFQLRDFTNISLHCLIPFGEDAMSIMKLELTEA